MQAHTRACLFHSLSCRICRGSAWDPFHILTWSCFRLSEAPDKIKFQCPALENDDEGHSVWSLQKAERLWCSKMEKAWTTLSPDIAAQWLDDPLEFCCTWTGDDSYLLELLWELNGITYIQHLSSKWCNGLNVRVSQNSCAEPLTPMWWYWEVGSCRWSGHADVPSWVGLLPFEEKTQELALILPFPSCGGTSSLQPRGRCSLHHWGPDLRFSASRAVRKMYLFFIWHH